MQLIDMSGLRVGRLSVVKRVGSNKSKQALWLCSCDCGNEKVLVGSNLRNGDTTSCGCVHREQIAERNRRNVAENSPCWKGGVTDLNHQIRNTDLFAEWRMGVYRRDGFSCRECGQSKKLHAHHIKHLSKIVSENGLRDVASARGCGELWDVDNGITLCVPCHSSKHPERRLVA